VHAADDGHKIRLKVLAKEMVKAVETLGSLQARASDLYIASNPGCDWEKSAQPPNNAGISSKTTVEAAQPKGHPLNEKSKTFTRILPALGSSAPADEDLIDLGHHA
jgi:hypothetical protein